MAETERLLPDLERPPNVDDAVYVGKTSSARTNWRRRFVVLAALGTVLTVYLSYVMIHTLSGFWYSYVFHGALPLKISVAEAESVFDKVLSLSNYARNWSYHYTQQQHLLGQNWGLVEWTKAKFEEYGLKDTKVETYHVYLNTPVDHGLLLVKNGKAYYTASLEEDALPEDPTSLNDTVPTFHGYSASGNVTASYFYANYGRQQDFAALVTAGVDMKGKIAIVRYGEIYRGLKVKFAQEVGAVGVVMYSDPGDDGEFIPQNGYEQYPKGPARNEASVQRGSVMYLSYGPGDPTTPGYASKKGVPRVDPHGTTPEIPSLPVSYRDIAPILKELNGLGIKGRHLGPDWVGKLEGYDYSVGLSKKGTHSPLLNLYNNQSYGIVPIHNVFGTIKGINSNEVVVVGNHRDSWIRGGAGDPNSGSAVMLEILRAFQEASKKGFKPYRTIVFASWDGEEPGLLGLTEWAEDHADWIKKNVVAYFNLDSAVTGHTLLLQSSPVLNNLLLSVAKEVDHPQGGTLFEHYANGPFQGQVDILGSGSDYTVFLEHLGIPSFDMGFACNPTTDPIYQYHLNYDSFYWMETFTDPGFTYHNVMSKYLGKIIMRLSGSESLLFDPYEYAKDIETYFNDALKKVPSKWYHYKGQHLEGDHEHLWAEISSVDSRLAHTWHNGTFKPVKDFTEAVKLTKKAIESFKKNAKNVNDHRADLQNGLYKRKGMVERSKQYYKLQMNNLKLGMLEQVFLHSEGLNDRPWFKHSIFASGRYTGYAGQSLPGFREAIEDDDPEEAIKWLNVHWMTIYVASVLMLLGE